MMKKELGQQVAQQCGVSYNLTSLIIDALFDSIMRSTKESQQLVIRNFGSFTVTKRAARKVVNPNTKELIRVPESQGINFRPSKKFKAVLSESNNQ